MLSVGLIGWDERSFLDFAQAAWLPPWCGCGSRDSWKNYWWLIVLIQMAVLIRRVGPTWKFILSYLMTANVPEWSSCNMTADPSNMAHILQTVSNVCLWKIMYFFLSLRSQLTHTPSHTYIHISVYMQLMKILHQIINHLAIFYHTICLGRRVATIHHTNPTPTLPTPHPHHQWLCYLSHKIHFTEFVNIQKFYAC